MFIKATVAQVRFLLRKRGTLCVFYILLLMVLANFIGNVMEFQGKDVIQMYQPVKLLLLSYNRVNYNANATLLLVQLYPLLVVCPAGFSLAKEYQSGQEVFMTARLGRQIYRLSKLVSAFLATAIVFSVPFFIEIILNSLSFPWEAAGDFYNRSPYNMDYIQGVHNYFMSGIYLYSPWIYAVLGTFFLGMVSGIFGAFTVAFSSIIKIKYNVFLFLPVFLLLNSTVFLTEAFPAGARSIRWYDYLLMFNDESKNYVFLAVGLLSILLFSVLAVQITGRKDCL